MTQKPGPETEVFVPVFNRCIESAAAHPDTPPLVVYPHCTRAKATDEGMVPPLIPGRPKLPAVLDEANRSYPGAPTFVFACGPSIMVNQLWDETCRRNCRRHRVDFHHETFEF